MILLSFSQFGKHNLAAEIVAYSWEIFTRTNWISHVKGRVWWHSEQGAEMSFQHKLEFWKWCRKRAVWIPSTSAWLFERNNLNWKKLFMVTSSNISGFATDVSEVFHIFYWWCYLDPKSILFHTDWVADLCKITSVWYILHLILSKIEIQWLSSGWTQWILLQEHPQLSKCAVLKLLLFSTTYLWSWI